MFKVNTPQGERFMVMLVGPASYRMGEQITYRGQSLTVTKRTRDYLVRKTNGAWKDFDPTPPDADFEPILPPQFGEFGGPSIDMSDINPKRNPAISLEHAMQLAERGGEVPTNEPAGIDPDDLGQTPEGAALVDTAGAGDMTGADLNGAKTPGSGGKTASAKTGGVTLSSKPPAKAGAITVE